YDWSREINSTDPSYYKWTQWFFLLLYKKGLAYQEESLQWWCPFDKTVLANEQVEDGRCWRCGNLVEKKALKQWFFRITDYADRLADDLDNINWSEAIKAMQRNWIGRSQGAEINFVVPTIGNYVLLHGFTGSSKNNFFPWAIKQLEDVGGTVYVPDLPNTKKPDAKEQAEFVVKSAKFDKNTVLLGHSYGSVSALRVVESLKGPIKKLVLAGGFAEPGFLDRERNFEATTDWNFDFEKIKKNVEEVVILRADNDSAVPRERADFLREKLGGTIVDFTAEGNHITAKHEPIVLENLIDAISVFTTRPDTIYGATFLVLAPEHKILNKLSISKEVKDYIEQAERKSEIDRMETEREKTGVFTGAYATNPANKEKIPIWVADYVLPGYGTGAIMAVPAHDERDWEFAKKFKLPIVPVILPQVDFCVTYIMGEKNITKSDIKDVGGTIVDVTDSGFLKVEFPKERAKDFEKLIIQKMEPGFWNEYIGDEVVFIFKHKDGNTQRFVLKIKTDKEIGRLGHKFNNQEYTDESVWEWIGANAFYGAFFLANKEGLLINSDKYDGLPSAEAREKIVADLAKQKAAKEKVNYKIRDWLISRQRYWGAPIPIIHCQKCGVVPVPEDQLPVQLPELKKFEPAGDGRGPLANVPEFVNVKCPKCGGKAERETDTMDGFACSSWYFLRFADPHNSQKAFAKAKIDFWLPVDDYIGGAEHAVMHLLYARFWTKVMFDEKLIDFDEPFKTLRNQGMILAPDGRKMSKSWNNTIEPDELIKRGYGADAIRLLELFIGPWNQSAAWSVEGLGGTYRFLQRVWTLVQEFLDETEDQRSKIKD
ncbi:MAG TPA: alpha/beta fold hydrolase, partial [Candidatus Saccharimonadales bacterium]|nr:alpha/beta fold hydrolase [Candidatus Saccharimonadales bacterium]